MLALVTSHFSLDKHNGTAREYLASKADFVAAVRLPSDAFKRQGTAVVTDMLFLRRRAADQPPEHTDPDWLAVASLPIDGVEVTVNRYFLNHPEMVLGTWTLKHALYEEDYSVAGNGDLAEQLAGAIDRLPRFPPLPSRQAVQSPTLGFAMRPSDQSLAEESFLTDDEGTICQWLDGQAVGIVYAGVPLSARGTLTGRRMAALIGLRTYARRVLESQNDDRPEAERHRARRELNLPHSLSPSWRIINSA